MVFEVQLGWNGDANNLNLSRENKSVHCLRVASGIESGRSAHACRIISNLKW